MKKRILKIVVCLFAIVCFVSVVPFSVDADDTYTITYNTGTEGAFSDGTTSKTINVEKKNYTLYAHSNNIDDSGTKSGAPGTYQSIRKVITIPGADSINVQIRYGTYSSSYGRLYVIPGEYTGNMGVSTWPSASTYYSLYGYSYNSYRTVSYTIQGDTVTFGFYTNGNSYNNNTNYSYGFYAVVTGIGYEASDTVGEPVANNPKFRFAKWDNELKYAVDNNISTINAEYERYVYDITYEATSAGKFNAVGDTNTVTYALNEAKTSATIISGTEKSPTALDERYRFKKWDRVINWSSIESDQTLMAEYERYKYTVTYKATDQGFFETVNDSNSVVYALNSSRTSATIDSGEYKEPTSIRASEDYNFWEWDQKITWSQIDDDLTLNAVYGEGYGGGSWWKITPDKVLIIGVENEALTIPQENYDNWPWHDKAENILTCEFLDNVSAAVSMNEFFKDCTNLTSVNWNNLDASNTRTISGIFYNCSSLIIGDISIFSSSDYLTEANVIFSGCTSMITAKMNGLTFSSTQPFGGPFLNCTSLQNIEMIGLTFTGGSIVITNMFGGSIGLYSDVTIDVANWNLGNVQALIRIFCSDKIKEIKHLETWDVSNVSNMNQLFDGCSSVEYLNVWQWKCTNLQNAECMFRNCKKLKSSYDPHDNGRVNIGRYFLCSDMSTFEQNPKASEIFNISGWWDNINKSYTYTSKSLILQYMFFDCDSIKTLIFIDNQEGTRVYISNTNFAAAFYSMDSLENLVLKNIEYSNDSWNNFFGSMFANTRLNYLSIEGSKCDKTATYLFGGVVFSANDTSSRNLKYINVKNCDMSRATDLSGMFSGSKYLKCIYGLETWNTGNVTNMSQMFNGCNQLQSIAIEDWDVRKVTDMHYMFFNCSSLTDTGYKLDQMMYADKGPLRIQSSDGYYNYFGYIPRFDISEWQCNALTNINAMFYGCSSINYLLVDGLLTSRMTSSGSIGAAFYGLSNLYVFSCNDWYFNDSISMNNTLVGMFNGNMNVQTVVDAKRWRIPSRSSDKTAVFRSANINTIIVDDWDLTQTTSLCELFAASGYLDSIYGLNTWDVSGITDMTLMFNGCNYLDQGDSYTLDLSSWDTKNVTSMFHMFEGLSKIKKLLLNGFDTSALVTSLADYSSRAGNENMFTNMNNLNYVVLPDTFEFELAEGCSTTLPDNGNWKRIYDFKTMRLVGDAANRAVNNGPLSATDLTAQWDSENMAGVWVLEDYVLPENAKQQYNEDSTGEWTRINEDTWKYEFNVFNDDVDYYVTEADIEGFTSDLPSSGYKQVVNGEATITNTTTTGLGSLSITKNVEGIVTSDRFEVTVHLEGQAIPASGTKIIDGVIFTNGTGKFFLSDGETKTFNNLVAGVTYEVSEAAYDLYDTTYTNKQGTISADGSTCTITNTYNYVPPIVDPEYEDIAVRKLVPNKKEEVTVTRYSHTNNISDSGVRDGGCGADQALRDVVRIPGAQSLHIEIRQYGTYYGGALYAIPGEYTGEITSTVPSGAKFSRTGYSYSSSTTSFDVEGDTVTFGFYSSSNTDNNSATASYSYGYYAVVTNNLRLPEEYSFEAVFENLAPSQTYTIAKDSGNATFTADTNGSANVSFKLIADETATFKDIPEGATYQFVEEGGRYISQYKVEDASSLNQIKQISGYTTQISSRLTTALETVDAGENITVTYTNTLKKYEDLILELIVESGPEDYDFTVEAVFDNLEPGGVYNSPIGRIVADDEGHAEKSFKMNHNDSFKFEQLPVDATYKFTEIRSGYVVNYVNSDAIGKNTHFIKEADENDKANMDLATAVENLDEDELVTVKFINNMSDTTIKVTKQWNDENNLLGLRPTDIELHVLRDGDPVEFENITDWYKVGTTWTRDLLVEGSTGTLSVYEEVTSPYVSTTDSAANAAEVTDGEVTIVNNLPLRTLTITKRWLEDTATDRPEAISLHLGYLEGGQIVEEPIDQRGYQVNKTGNGFWTITMKMVDNDKEYVIWEDPADGYETDSDVNNKVTIVNDAATISNTKHHKISVSKTVAGNMGNKTDTFSFTITGEGFVEDGEITLNGQPYTPTISGNTMSFTLGHDDVLEVELKPDLEYTIAETDYSDKGYKTYINNSLLQQRSKTVTLDSDKSLAFTNRSETIIATGIRIGTITGGVITVSALAILAVQKKKKEKETLH